MMQISGVANATLSQDNAALNLTNSANSSCSHCDKHEHCKHRHEHCKNKHERCDKEKQDCCPSGVQSALQAEGTAEVPSQPPPGGPFPYLLTYTTVLKYGEGIEFDNASTFLLKKKRLYQVTYGFMLGSDTISAKFDLFNPAIGSTYPGSVINLEATTADTQVQVDKTVLIYSIFPITQLQVRLVSGVAAVGALSITDAYISITQLTP